MGPIEQTDPYLSQPAVIAVQERPLRRARSAPIRLVLLWLMYLAIAAATLGANPFRGETITPFDLLISQPAWAHIEPVVMVRNSERSDVLDSILPLWLNAKRQLQQHELPFWTDKPTGGSPALLVVSSTLLTPAFWIFAVIPSSPIGFYLAILFNLSVAGLGMHLFLRRHVGWLAAAMGAATFMLCGFHAAWLYWPHVFTSIWAPWLLMAIDRCAEKPGMRRSLEVAFPTAMLILGGFPFVTMLMLEAGGLYALVAFLRKARGKWAFVGWYSAGSWLGLLLCAIPIAGFGYWLQRFDIGYRKGHSILTWHDWDLLFPKRAWGTSEVELTMYVGFVGVLLALVAVLIVPLFLRRRSLQQLPVFGTCLLVIAAGFVFGLWPARLVGWLPGFSFNPWSRAICILDLSLAVLAAFALDTLWRIRGGWWRHALRVALVGVALVQVCEVALFFRQFNGPVPDNYFYPPLPAISYMQQHAGPFDYVVADQAFMISGTLGAYGLREWFAHGFRTPALAHDLTLMARNPFDTPTATQLNPGDLKVHSPVLAEFNVRYIAMGSDDYPVFEAPVRPSGSSGIPLPPLPDHQWAQGFEVGAAGEKLEGVAVRFATYGKARLPGTIELVLHDVSGRAVARADFDAAEVIDNQMVGFAFARTVALNPGKYVLDLHYHRPTTSASPITAWAFTNPEAGDSLRVDGKAIPATLDYKLLLSADETPFRKVYASNGINVFENMTSPKGPYFLKDLRAQPNGASGADVRLASYKSDGFSLSYVGEVAGYVVVPMMWTRDWRIRVNGDTVGPALLGGVLPEVPVAGPSTITFAYQPRLLRWWWPWLGVLAMTLLTMGLAAALTRKR